MTWSFVVKYIHETFRDFWAIIEIWIVCKICKSLSSGLVLAEKSIFLLINTMQTTILIGIIFFAKVFHGHFSICCVLCRQCSCFYSQIVGGSLSLSDTSMLNLSLLSKKKYVCHPPHKYPCTVLWRLLLIVK